MKWQRQIQWQAKDTMGDFNQSSKLKVKSFIFCSVDKTAHKLSMKWQNTSNGGTKDRVTLRITLVPRFFWAHPAESLDEDKELRVCMTAHSSYVKKVPKSPVLMPWSAEKHNLKRL